MNYQTRALNTLPLREAVELFNRGFDGYFVPVQFTEDSFKTFVQRDNVDFKASQILLRDGQPIGIALITCREKASRMGGFGIIKEFRGKGAGSWFMKRLLDAARERAETQMHLEVITQNESAVRLYKKHGFTRRRRLIGFKAEKPAGKADAHLQAYDQALILDMIDVHGLPDLPWQLDAKTLQSVLSFGHRLGEAFGLTSDPRAEQISIRSLLVPAHARGQGQAIRLLEALFGSYPGRVWHVPAIFPEEMGSTFMRARMQPELLSQWQMVCNL